jgi:ABC-type antimicrobial peptide transport system permease subunit
MGRLLLTFRLVSRDIRHRPGEALMLLFAIMAATGTLTLGLVLHGETSRPYEQTRSVTRGPDVVASGATNQQGVTTRGALGQLEELAQAPGVSGHSGPFPATVVVLRTQGIVAGAQVEGRTQVAAVDQPKVTQGSWIRPGGAVIEQSFADALGVHSGNSVTLNGHSFKVVGVAVTAAFTPYPQICVRCFDFNLPQLSPSNTGLIWLTRSDARSLATSAEPMVYFLNLRLHDPALASRFATTYAGSSSTSPQLTSWQQLDQQDGIVLRNTQEVMLVGSWLLGLLAVASVAVLVGGRMTDHTRRVGLLKAVGGTPGLVATVLLTEYMCLALLAAAAGLAAGWMVAPILTKPGAGLLGTAGAPALTLADCGAVVAVAVAVAMAAALMPAIRAARTSTVRALADSTRPLRRRTWVITISAYLPVPILLGVRIAARRPRRVVLSAISVAVTVSGIVAVLFAHASLNASQLGVSSGLDNPQTGRTNEVLSIIVVMLVALAAVNAVFITRATVTDSRQTSAVTRALGATPQQISAGLSAAQVLPALIGAVVGIPLGIGLYLAVKQGETVTSPPIWMLIGVVLGAVVVVAGLTGLPARIAARGPVAEMLHAE